MNRNRFGTALRRLRNKRGATLKDLANAIGKTITFISEVERGNKNPPSELDIKKLLNALDATDQLGEMLHLADVSRRSVELELADKREDVAEMLAALARRCDENSIDDETARKISQLLKHGVFQDGRAFDRSSTKERSPD